MNATHAPAAAQPGPRSLVEPRALSLADSTEFAAASYYEQRYWCGEAVLKAVNETLGSPLPDDVSRLASGFCEGLGGSRCICGALAGGVMACGMVTGRSGPRDAWEPSYDAAGELRRRWTADQKAESCDEVVRRIGDMDDPRRWAHCAELVGHTARWVIEILDEGGYLAR